MPQANIIAGGTDFSYNCLRYIHHLLELRPSLTAATVQCTLPTVHCGKNYIFEMAPASSMLFLTKLQLYRACRRLHLTLGCLTAEGPHVQCFNRLCQTVRASAPERLR
jgi:hypothetical protein